MLRVLVFGGALIAATVVVHTFGLLVLTRIMTTMVGTLRLDTLGSGDVRALTPAEVRRLGGSRGS